MMIIAYVFAASFVFLGAALMLTYRQTRNIGVLVIGTTYVAAAVLTVALAHWWPLVAGFVVAWILRLAGLDPDARKDETPQ